jgi:VIT1/CCC1 family predicted Fe2+/Mn2+ transporter
MLVRFGVRMIILVVFATFGNIGFGASLTALLWMSAIFSAVIAVIKREPPFDSILNHWDETVAYAALCCLVVGLNHAVPF